MSYFLFNLQLVYINLEYLYNYNLILGIKGYLKTKFARSINRLTNVTYGCGAITDGEYKIAVQVSNYDLIDIPKGKFLTVRGEVKKDGEYKN